MDVSCQNFTGLPPYFDFTNVEDPNGAQMQLDNLLKSFIVQGYMVTPVDGHFGCYLFCLNLHEKGK